MPSRLKPPEIDRALGLLAQRLNLAGADPIQIVVCGGAALMALGLRVRTTRDVDIVALIDTNGTLQSPDPIPRILADAATAVGRDLGLFEGWLNNEPSRGEGGLFQMGLPDGFAARLTAKKYGPSLTAHFISRLDQIHFKLYAAVDQQQGAHFEDLKALSPTESELEQAARWSMTHDTSDGFRFLLKETILTLGHEKLAARL